MNSVQSSPTELSWYRPSLSHIRVLSWKNLELPLERHSSQPESQTVYVFCAALISLWRTPNDIKVKAPDTHRGERSEGPGAGEKPSWAVQHVGESKTCHRQQKNLFCKGTESRATACFQFILLCTVLIRKLCTEDGMWIFFSHLTCKERKFPDTSKVTWAPREISGCFSRLTTSSRANEMPNVLTLR